MDAQRSCLQPGAISARSARYLRPAPRIKAPKSCVCAYVHGILLDFSAVFRRLIQFVQGPRFKNSRPERTFPNPAISFRSQNVPWSSIFACHEVLCAMRQQPMRLRDPCRSAVARIEGVWVRSARHALPDLQSCRRGPFARNARGLRARLGVGRDHAHQTSV